MRPKISVVIIGKNEEKNIVDCIKSVSDWAEEIIFIDDLSTDSTIDLVKKEKRTVIFQRKMDLEGKQRNFGAQKAKNDWIMMLDCDERATPEVKKEIDELFSNKDEKDVAFWIPRKNYIGDYWMRWGGWYPAPHIKFYNKNYFRWKECVYDVVHPGIEFFVPGYKQGKNLSNHLIHHNYANIEDFIRKTNRLTTLDAIKWYLDARRMTMGRAFYRFIDRFLRRYVRKKGYRDGYYGFIASFLSGFYELAAYSKYSEIIKKGYYLKENGITEEIIAKSLRGQGQGFSKFKRLRICLSSIPMIIKVTLRNMQRKKFENEVYFLKKILNRDDVCLDIGGAYGRYAFPMSKLVKKGKVISFEPGQYSFFVLSAIKAIFRMRNVVIIKKALGRESKKSFLISPIKKTGRIGYSLSYVNDAVVSNSICEPIEITSIDNFFNSAKMNRLDFIKCDTEGTEMTIFYGGADTIKKYRPVVLSEVEDEHLRKFNNSTQEIETFFKKLAYKIFYLEENELLEKAKIDRDSNYFFIPEEKVNTILSLKIAQNEKEF